MIGKKAALGQELFHIPVGERKAQLPTHSQKNDFRFKLTPLEQVTYRRAEYHIGRFIRPFLQTCNTTCLRITTRFTSLHPTWSISHISWSSKSTKYPSLPFPQG